MEYLRLLGSGGQAKIYLVRKEGMLYACKESDKAASLEREAYFLRQVNYAGFAGFREFSVSSVKARLLMEYIDGSTLAEYIHGRGRPVYESAYEILLQVAEALAYLHSLSDPILYRDLKPENIMLDSSGKVKLIDMGCACHAYRNDGRMAGTKGYAPKEQTEKLGNTPPQGFYSDVFSFGRLAHYLLTGDSPYLPPFEKPDIRSYSRAFDKGLAGLVASCVRADPRSRPPDMRCVLHELTRYAPKKKHKWIIPAGRGKRFYSSGYIYEKNILLR